MLFILFHVIYNGFVNSNDHSNMPLKFHQITLVTASMNPGMLSMNNVLVETCRHDVSNLPPVASLCLFSPK